MRHRRAIGVLALVGGVVCVGQAVALGAVGVQSGYMFAEAGGFYGHVSQGYLGVDVRDVSDGQMAALKLKEARGAEIIHVDHDGPAGKAGLHEHDVVLQMNGQAIEGEEQLRRMLRETPPGRSLTLVISRDGQQQTVTALMANREEVERQAWEQHMTVPEPPPASSQESAAPHVGNGFFKSGAPSSVVTQVPKGHREVLGVTMILSSSFTGAQLELMGPQLAEFFGAQGSAGLLVRSVDENSPAAIAGMKAGDVVVKVNQITVVNGSDWSKTVHENKGHPVPVVVLRDKHETTLTLTPDGKKRSSVKMPAGLQEYLSDTGQASALVAEL
jgi:serine protease Do